MKNLKRKERREAQFAILLTFLGCWAFDASICRGQAAGFAQSRQQTPQAQAPFAASRFSSGSGGAATSGNEGGGFRSFVANLNPFKSDDSPSDAASTPSVPPSSPSRISLAVGGSQYAAANEQDALIGSPRSFGRTADGSAQSGQSTARANGDERLQSGRALVGATASGAASRQTSVSRYGTTRPTVAAAPGIVGGSKKSTTGGVASHLLDELAAEIGDRPANAPRVDAKKGAKTSRDQKTIRRRSLRDDETLDALELLDADSSDALDETDSEIIATDADVDSDLEESGEYEIDGDAAVLSTESSDSADEDAISTDETSGDAENSAELADEPAIPTRSTKAVPQRKRRAQPKAEQTPRRERAENEEENAPKKAKTQEKYAVQVDDETENPNENGSLDERVDEILSENPNRFSESPTYVAAEESVKAEKTIDLTPRRDDTWQSDADGDSTVVSAGSPIVEIETVGPQRLVVGQETTYTIRVRNAGKFAARKLVVSTELPETVAASNATTRQGSASIEDAPLDSISDAKRCVWKVGTLEPGAQTELTLKVTPIKRSAFELISEFEFERSAARTGVEVSEPILEARIEGRDSIERGVEDQYRLRVRNVGNGDAENVALFVSTGENEATQRLGVLKAGEEKTLEITLQTVLEGSISIAVRATGDYGLEASATKTIAVLRGKLETSLETPELQFVDGEFEAVVRARNAGDAALQEVVVVAQTPENVELLACAGNARRNDEKRRVYWTIPLLRPNEEAVYRLQCRLTREGDATFALVGTDRSGETAQSVSTVQVESIAALAMRVKSPKSPVAVGKECVYELIVENNGTKEAQAVDSGVFLGAGLKPLAVENEAGVVYEAESKVIFKQIERLPAGESVVFRVRAQAVAAGNHKVQAMLQSIPEDARLLSEETTYCYDRNRATRPNLETTPSFIALEPSETESTQRK